MNSQSLTGFLLANYSELYKQYLTQLIEQVVSNKLRIVLDFGQNTSEGKFEGIDSVVRGVEVIVKLFF
jgi:hypothetical protein